MTYRAPIDDICFALEAQVGLDEIRALPQFAETDKALTRAILEEAGKFAEKTIAPLNASADREGCALEGSEVRTASGFREAYGLYAAGGWSAMSAPPAHGGQGLPLAISVAAQEMFSAACTSFALAPLLTFGSIEALAAHGTDAQKRDYLPKLVSGEWTGTMNLTEPQAGSDVGALTTKAVPQSDGSYKITGTKIFISFGEHDLTDNIIHLVLGRLPDAPSGTRGISLFLVPKFLPDGARNDLACIGLERKLGIHASPTCVMQYGAGGGGWRGGLAGRRGKRGHGVYVHDDEQCAFAGWDSGRWVCRSALGSRRCLLRRSANRDAPSAKRARRRLFIMRMFVGCCCRWRRRRRRRGRYVMRMR